MKTDSSRLLSNHVIGEEGIHLPKHSILKPSQRLVAWAIGMSIGALLGFGTFSSPKAIAMERQGGSVVTGSTAQPTQSTATQQPPTGTTIQATPIEINASAPKPDPDPYALPSNAPEFLIKMRQDLEKSYTEHRVLANQMLDFLASTNFDIKSPMAREGSPAVKTYSELLRKLEMLNSKIETSEAEFIHEKLVFLAHGTSSTGQTASVQAVQTKDYKLVHDQ